jgi:hypothetical protein
MPVSDEVRVIRQTRRWEYQYNIIVTTINYPVVVPRLPEDLTGKLALTVAVTDRIHWFDKYGNKLPKSVGWIVRNFAKRS